MKNLLKFFLKYQHFILLLFMISIAFSRNMESVKGLNFGFDLDSGRDLGNIHNLLDGNFGNDPSYLGEYMWYNPLITLIEGGIVKLTGLSPVWVVTKSGVFLDILCVLLFYYMSSFLFNSKIAIASTAAFLFFSTGDMASFNAATYSPWIYPVNFMQSIFYIGIVVLYKAFTKPGNLSFMLGGLVTGIAFLGHLAPAMILLLVWTYLFLSQFRHLLKSKSTAMMYSFLKYGIFYLISFALISSPFLFYIVGKYGLHMVNHSPSNYMDSLFILQNLPQLIKLNISISFLISVFGAYYIYFIYERSLKRNILLAWFFATVILYCYTSFVPVANLSFGITLPGIVPTFHFFFYLKAFQSVLFGLGFCFLVNILLKRIFRKRDKEPYLINSNNSPYVTILILVFTLIYYPVYSKRNDFYTQREFALRNNALLDEIEIYHWLLNNTNINDVVVSDIDLSRIPVMASGRKQVAVSPSFSNPFVNYSIRNRDRIIIMNSFYDGKLIYNMELLIKYNVKFILLENKRILNSAIIENSYGKPVFKNKKFTIYKSKN